MGVRAGKRMVGRRAARRQGPDGVSERHTRWLRAGAESAAKAPDEMFRGWAGGCRGMVGA
jgi:hypothetical protein